MPRPPARTPLFILIVFVRILLSFLLRHVGGSARQPGVHAAYQYDEVRQRL
jgi:hypothetical protein